MPLTRVRRRLSRGRVVLVAAATVALGLALTSSPVVADDHDETSHHSRQAGGTGASAALAGAGAAAAEPRRSPNMRLVANLPKSGPFAAEDSFNSDLAFQGDYAFAGNYNGFSVYDISRPIRPRLVTQVVCPGSQGDMAVHRNLLVMAVDDSRSDDSCNSVDQGAEEASSWEGIRVFDISDPANPRYVAAVETDCGAHTHTLAPGQGGVNLFVYTSSYFPAEVFPDCQPPHDKISVVKIPVATPSAARVIATPRLFPGGGNPPGGYSFETSGCHDITAYPSKDIAAGACMGDGILLDISDRARPRVTERVRDTENFFFWHSATFSNDGDKVVFTDELGGGGAPTCNPRVGSDKGADGIYDLRRGELVFRSYYKMPRTQANTENCVAHNGSLIPVEGRDMMVQAWYQGGISVFDFTNSARPREIAYFDRPALSTQRLVIGGSWSAYWYNGFVYSNDIQLGFDVFEIRDSRLGNAPQVRQEEFNPQTQPSYNG